MRDTRTQSPVFNRHVLTLSLLEHINAIKLILCGIHDFAEVYLGSFQAYMIELELIVVNYFGIKATWKTFVPKDVSALKHAFVSSEYVYEIVFQVVLL